MIPQCKRIMPNGYQCGSPAKRGQSYCYYHHPEHKPRTRRPRTRYPNLNLETLPDIESPRAIQQSLSAVLHGLATNTISLYQAQTMIYALQLASNLNR